MSFNDIKTYFRNLIAVACPKLWYLILRNKTYRSNRVINDLTIYPQLTRSYSTESTYVTMFAKPPFHYNRIMRAREFDDKGIPCQNGLYNLVSICQYGLSEYGYYKSTGRQEHLEHARGVCEWLIQNQEENTGYWRYQFDFLHRGTGCSLHNWPSALGQGQAASLLVRMYTVMHDENYLETAHRAFNMFDVPVEEGGLFAKFNGYSMYEEYPTTPPSFTLNGMIFSLFGLFDYLQVKHDIRVQQLWTEGINAIEYMLPLYDDDITSNYDISHVTARKIPKIKGDKYHIIHITLLQNLESIAPRPTFEYYIRKWAKMSGFTIK